MRLFPLFLVSLEVVLFFVDRCSGLSAGGDHQRNPCRSQRGQSSKETVVPLPATSSRAEAVSLPCRRQWLGSLIAGGAAVGAWTLGPSTALARYVLDEETGDYVEVEEADWQTAWKQRYDKASTMSMDEIVQAARGAGNVELKGGIESDASKKRRAMSACRDVGARQKANAGSEKDCTARVFAGEVDFMLNVL